MTIHHKNLVGEKWNSLSFFEQMANIGSEVERTISWQKKKKEYSDQAFERALELIDFTLADPKNKNRLKEIARTREAMVDHFVYDNEYNSTDEIWKKYFFAFAWAARLGK